VLSDAEVPLVWSAFDDAGLIVGSALKLILLLGQRPGEVAHMRHEHIRDGWRDAGRSGAERRVTRR
jgi:integrase